MTIKTRLQITTVVGILLALGIGLFIFFVNQRLNEVVEENRRVDEIVRGVFELNILTNDYLLRRSERTTDQWWSRYNSISRMLIEAEALDDSKRQARIGVLRENHSSISTTFFQLVTVLGRAPSEERSTASKELEDRLVSQLAARSQTMVASAFTLARENRQELTERQQQLSLFTLAAIFILAAIIAASSLLTATRVLRPLLELKGGAEIIGKGNLKHRIKIKSKDEIGQLAASFNTMAQELKESYSGLEEKVKELQVAMEELKELDKLKDNFLNIAAHELKTPLIPIHSQVQLLMKDFYGKIEGKQKEALEMIYRNEKRLTELVTDVLDISRIRSKKLKLILDDVSLEDIVANAVSDIEKLADKEYVKVVLEPIPKLSKLRVDGKRITQVMGNLLSNALKFTPEKGEVVVKVTSNENEAVVSVRDTGIGMSKRTLRKLFTPFFQADTNITRKYGGTGLGLSICKGIIEVHGGRIWAESEGKDKGSTFTFVLPKKLRKI